MPTLTKADAVAQCKAACRRAYEDSEGDANDLDTAIDALAAALAAPDEPAPLPREVQRVVDAARESVRNRDVYGDTVDIRSELDALSNAVAALPATPARSAQSCFLRNPRRLP